ncbi:MAG: type III-A CRISPR-associated RAMP protein Csm3 [Moorellaceae bacterium]
MTANLRGGKIFIEGIIRCVTGLHIGGSQEPGDIGGVDQLVVRDPFTRQPYIPGSSLKGKLRSLLERYHFARDPSFLFDRNKIKIMTSGGQQIRLHECGREDCTVCRIFGASRGGGGPENMPASLYVRDAYLTEESKHKLERINSGYYLSEVKFENALDRITCAANPRQVERVPRSACFYFQMVYNLWRPRVEQHLREDIKEVMTGLQLLEDDYLGGHGSRGYGQIRFDSVRMIWRSPLYYRGEAEEKSIATNEGQRLSDFAAQVDRWLYMVAG